MTQAAKALFITAAIVLLLAGASLFALLVVLSGEGAGAVLRGLRDEGVVFLYERNLVGELSAAEATRLYQRSCTRRCHGRDVIEKKPRTAAEWEALMARMKAPDRADLRQRAADAITRHLQNHYLSNVPTVLPDATMRFVRRHLWRSDFGEGDLFVDVIYVPRTHFRLLRYLGVRDQPADSRAALFVVFINTHRGSIPPWDLAETSVLQTGSGARRRATGWQVLYRDREQHHKQGLLTFAELDVNQAEAFEIAMELRGLGIRTFRWQPPVPPLPE